MSKFYSNYYKSIENGLNNSVFYLNYKIIEPELFFNKIKKIIQKLQSTKSRIYFLGNGASSSFANHMALDFKKNGKILSQSLSDSALLTALSNDFSYENAMIEFLKIENVTSNDLIVTISSSGNSKNIVNALKFCKKNNINTLSLSGLNKNNSSIKAADYSIFVPKKTYGIVECIHQIYLHLILDDFMEVKEWEKTESQNMNIKKFSI